MADDARGRRRRPPSAHSAPGRGVAFYVGAIGSALFLVRLLGASWSTHFPAVWPDAVFPKQGYLAVAGKSPFRPSFYFAFRPIGYPFFLWMLGRSTQLVVVVQTALYCAVVVALCATALRVMRSRAVAVVATVVLIVGIALQAKYAMWNTQILSESLAISLGFAAIAAWWRFAAAPTPRPGACGASAFVIAWLLVRDAHVLPATIVIVPVGAGRRRGSARASTAACDATLVVGAVAVVIAVAAYSYFSAERVAPRRAVVPRRRRDPHPPRPAAHASGSPATACRSTTRCGPEPARAGSTTTSTSRRTPRSRRTGTGRAAPGPRALALSLVVLAPHYCDLMNDDLPDDAPGRRAVLRHPGRLRPAAAADAAATRRPDDPHRARDLARRSRGAALARVARARAPAQARARARRVRRDRARAHARRALHDMGRRSGRDANATWSACSAGSR